MIHYDNYRHYGIILLTNSTFFFFFFFFFLIIKKLYKLKYIYKNIFQYLWLIF
jgi:hypothetical protein